MTTLLVTGGSGQLAGALDAAASACDIHRVGRPDFDFDRPESIDETFLAITPALVVNAAAYTAVDAAETDPRRPTGPTTPVRRGSRNFARASACR